VHASEEVVLENLAGIRGVIEDAARRAGRDPAEVSLVAAAKTVPPQAVRWVAQAGVRAIGHNYVQELRDARAALADLPLRWHYIGTLQSSTAHTVADLADVVETVAGEHAARRLAGRAERSGKVLDALIEVDLTEERSGVRPSGLAAFADLVAGLPGIRLRGLMTLPPIPERAEDARPWFARLRELRDRLAVRHPQVLDLSMGMSLDYPVAVEEGATMVRIGTALFGPRTP
jgi:pyridoxal phosphate enzyme (YggS family)